MSLSGRLAKMEVAADATKMFDAIAIYRIFDTDFAAGMLGSQLQYFTYSFLYIHLCILLLS